MTFVIVRPGGLKTEPATGTGVLTGGAWPYPLPVPAAIPSSQSNTVQPHPGFKHGLRAGMDPEHKHGCTAAVSLAVLCLQRTSRCAAASRGQTWPTLWSRPCAGWCMGG